MINRMFVLKFNKCTFDEWKHEMDEDTEMDGLFMKDVMIQSVQPGAERPDVRAHISMPATRRSADSERAVSPASTQ